MKDKLSKIKGFAIKFSSDVLAETLACTAIDIAMILLKAKWFLNLNDCFLNNWKNNALTYDDI